MTLQHIINIDGIVSYADNSLLLSAAVLSAYYANISTKRVDSKTKCNVLVFKSSRFKEESVNFAS